MKKFKIAPGLGEESQTDEFFVDAAGKAWPIYSKIIDFGVGPNAAAKSLAHNIANLKADGHFKISHAQFTKAATAPVILDGAALVGTLTLTNVVLTATADLTTFSGGRATIEYTKTTD
jgi:hypothetical protein